MKSLAILLAVIALPAEARFLLEDSGQVDREERNNTETYNDKISYRYPVAWDRLWAAHETGFRVSAGSLNLSRFDYLEDLKFQPFRDRDAAFAYKESRREDFIEARTERELRAGYRFLDLARVSILADGGSYKEYGDLGVALAADVDRDRKVELFFWSVDHYYATKKSDPDDSRDERARSAGLDATWLFGATRVTAFYETDLPFTWRRPSRGEEYHYERRLGTGRVEHALTPQWMLIGAGEAEWKQESKAWGATNQAKAMERHTTFGEVGAVHSGGGIDVAFGSAFVYRRAQYRQEIGAATNEDELEEPLAPAASTRREPMLYVTRYAPLHAHNHFWQTGLHANDPRVREFDRSTRATEVKWQFLWEYRYDEKSRVVLNTTWDVDQLQKDFPYDERTFRPWGGGNIQFLAVF